MEEQSVTEPGVSAEPAVEGEAPSTPAGASPTSPVTPEVGLAELRNQLAALERRLQGIPTADAIIESVVRHPTLKQSMRDMTEARVAARAQEIYKELRSQIDGLEEAGAISDPLVAQKQRRAAEQRAHELAKQELGETAPAAAAGLPDYSAEVNSIFADLGLGWGDFPEFQGRATVSISEVRQLAPRRAAEKAYAQRKAAHEIEFMKEYEKKAKEGKEKLSAATPPPQSGTASDNPIKDIEDPRELYRLASLEMQKGGRK